MEYELDVNMRANLGANQKNSQTNFVQPIGICRVQLARVLPHFAFEVVTIVVHFDFVSFKTSTFLLIDSSKR